MAGLHTIFQSSVRKTSRMFCFAAVFVILSLILTRTAFAQAASGSIFRIESSPNGSTKPVSNNLLVGATSISSSDIWAVGFFSKPTATNFTLTEHWNGTKWTLIPSPNGASGSVLNAVSSVSSTDVWAVGIQDTNGSVTANRTLTEHWNGTKWSVVPSPNASVEGDVLTGVVAISTNDVWAVGYFENNLQTLILPLLEHWNGTQWSIAQDPPVSFGVNFVQAVTAASTNDVWAVGFTQNGADNENLIMHWDGTQWSILPTVVVPSDGNVLQAVTSISSTDAWAVGKLNVNQGENSSNMALHWNGQKWSQVAIPNGGTLTNMLEGVTALSGNDVWAVGLAAQPPSGSNQTLIEHWNGTKWSVIPSPDENPQTMNPNSLFAVTAVRPGNVMAVGTWNSFQQGNPGARALTLLTTQG